MNLFLSTPRNLPAKRRARPVNFPDAHGAPARNPRKAGAEPPMERGPEQRTTVTFPGLMPKAQVASKL